MTLVIAIHGGAGTLPQAEIGETGLQDRIEGLKTALKRGWERLVAGGTAVDAVEAAVVTLENAPVFNAGHGAVFNADAEHELDAAIMDGATGAAGAIAGARAIRNPILAARRIMERTDHVLLAGGGADRFAREQGLELVPQSYFSTDQRRRFLELAQAIAAGRLRGTMREVDKHGTVGAVALDGRGNLAAATSTGGMTNKLPGRIGDTPVIGAGTYARNGACAVSCTGTGEFFVRHVAAHEIAARILYRGDRLHDAAHAVLFDDVVASGGSGGLVAVDSAGDLSMPFSTAGMHRGAITSAGDRYVGIYRDLIRFDI
jgi:beta-aspartyl-peptidase (threonine type)